MANTEKEYVQGFTEQEEFQWDLLDVSHFPENDLMSFVLQLC